MSVLSFSRTRLKGVPYGYLLLGPSREILGTFQKLIHFIWYIIFENLTLDLLHRFSSGNISFHSILQFIGLHMYNKIMKLHPDVNGKILDVCIMWQDSFPTVLISHLFEI